MEETRDQDKNSGVDTVEISEEGKKLLEDSFELENTDPVPQTCITAPRDANS